eukprot:TRINITY_DN4735_c0_g2_i1.p1 TRINITY_DN4735_c0_g2~~TRINITY_DN4735_c0_g2_i1.p1  ORF type:complete len:1181 (+),score=400.15 TRINITY_DN4735_c0_g2_i1:34-3576(+)
MENDEDEEEYESLTCVDIVDKIINLSYEQGEEAEDQFDELVDWFLFRFNPEESFLNVQNNSEALRNPDLLHVIMTKFKTAYEADIFLEALNVLTCLEDFEIPISEKGGPQVTVQMMGKEHQHARCQILGGKILANLAVVPGVRSWIGKVKGVTKLLDSIKNNKLNSDVIVSCCKALINISYNSMENKEIVVSLHGIETLVETMKLHPSHYKLANLCLTALRNIASATNIKELQQHLLVREIVTYLEEYTAVSGIQVNAIWVLNNLITGHPDLKDHVSEQGVVHRILHVMDIHKLDRDVILAISTTLALLSKRAAVRNEIQQHRGGLLLLSAMDDHKQDVPVQRACVKAIYRLTFNKKIRELLGPAAIDAIVKTMQLHPEEAALQRACILSLIQFAKTPDFISLMQRVAVTSIVSAMKRFNDVENVYKGARAALDLIVADVSNQTPVPPSSPAGVDLSVNTRIQELTKELEEKELAIKEYVEEVKRYRDLLDLEKNKYLDLEEKFNKLLLTQKSHEENHDTQIKELQQKLDELSKSNSDIPVVKVDEPPSTTEDKKEKTKKSKEGSPRKAKTSSEGLPPSTTGESSTPTSPPPGVSESGKQLLKHRKPTVRPKSEPASSPKNVISPGRSKKSSGEGKSSKSSSKSSGDKEPTSPGRESAESSSEEKPKSKRSSDTNSIPDKKTVVSQKRNSYENIRVTSKASKNTPTSPVPTQRKPGQSTPVPSSSGKVAIDVSSPTVTTKKTRKNSEGDSSGSKIITRKAQSSTSSSNSDTLKIEELKAELLAIKKKNSELQEQVDKEKTEKEKLRRENFQTSRHLTNSQRLIQDLQKEKISGKPSVSSKKVEPGALRKLQKEIKQLKEIIVNFEKSMEQEDPESKNAKSTTTTSTSSASKERKEKRESKTLKELTADVESKSDRKSKRESIRVDKEDKAKLDQELDKQEKQEKQEKRDKDSSTEKPEKSETNNGSTESSDKHKDKDNGDNKKDKESSSSSDKHDKKDKETADKHDNKKDKESHNSDKQHDNNNKKDKDKDSDTNTKHDKKEKDKDSQEKNENSDSSEHDTTTTTTNNHRHENNENLSSPSSKKDKERDDNNSDKHTDKKDKKNKDKDDKDDNKKDKDNSSSSSKKDKDDNKKDKDDKKDKKKLDKGSKPEKKSKKSHEELNGKAKDKQKQRDESNEEEV